MKPVCGAALLLVACDAEPDTTLADAGPFGSCVMVTVDLAFPGNENDPDGRSRDLWILRAEDDKPLSHAVNVSENGGRVHEERWVYEPDGDLTEYLDDWDFRQDRTTYTYSEAHELVDVSLDEWDDGTIDEQWTYTWEGGLLIREINVKGIRPWYEATQEYDEAGHLLKRRLTFATGLVQIYTYTWEGELRRSERFTQNKAAAWITAWSYDEAGRVVVEAVDEGINDVVDTVAISTWQGDYLVQVESKGVTGEVWERQTMTYDDAGRLRSHEGVRFDSAGQILYVWSKAYTYEDITCPPPEGWLAPS